MPLSTPLFIEQERYQLLRLILVNSASAAYIELPLYETAAILGSNNDGKTSLLNALKLFLLPEVNFKGCESKFGFSSHGQTYSGLESFNYYFPSQKSFIILEATNVRGDFCLVLHQNPSEELGYSRIAVPLAYMHIRHYFWNQHSRHNQGLGQHPAELSVATIQKQLLQLKGTRLTDTESIRNALYTRVSLLKPETRFCLIPLVQSPRPSMIRSIKALLQLSFDISGKSIDNLPLAIANIIDSELATGRQAINIDFKKIQADRQRLRQDAEQIERLRIHNKKWIQLTQAHEQHIHTTGQLHQTYDQLSHSIQALKAQYQPQLIELEQLHTSLKQEKTQIEDKLGQIRQTITTLNAEQSYTQQLITQLTTNLQRAEQTLQKESTTHERLDPNVLAVRLRERKIEGEQHLQTLLSHEKARSRLETLNSQRADSEKHIQHLESILAKGVNASFLSHLTAKTATVLNSLSPSFQSLETQPNKEQMTHLDHFAALFDVHCTHLCFAGETLTHSPIHIFDNQDWLKELEKQRLDAVQNNQKIQKQMQQLLNILRAEPAYSTTIIQKTREQIEQDHQAILALGSYEDNKEKNVALNEKQLEIEKNLAQNEGLLEKTQRLYAELTAKIEHLTEQRLELQKNSQLISSATKALSFLDALIDEQLNITLGNRDQTSQRPEAYLTIHELDPTQQRLEHYLKQYQQLKNEKMRLLQVLISARIIIIDPELSHAATMQPADFLTIYQKMQSQFDNLESRAEGHRNQVRQHNHETSLEITLLDEMAKAIRNFEEKINSQLSNIKISNLSGVKIVIRTLESFNTLQRDLAAHGSTSDQLMNESFYTRLQDFCEKYLLEGPNQGKLDLEKVITTVSFIYNFNGVEESVPQSNGTNSMMNAVLLSLLLKRLIPEDIALTIPVVFDEVGALDENNLSELRRVVENNGFQLLVANPHLTGYISAQINRWHDLFLCSLTEGSSIKKCFAIYLGDAESCLPIEPSTRVD